MERTFEIQEFPHDNKFWRFDGFGPLVHGASSKSDAFVVAHLSELKPDYLQSMSTYSLSESKVGKTCQIKVGQIPFLKMGSVWLNGVRQLPRVAPDYGELTISHEQLKVQRLRDPVQVNGRSYLVLDWSRYTVSTQSYKGLINSWVTVAPSPVDVLEFIVIPSSVIFQRCWATSSRAVHHLVYGQLNCLVDHPQWIPGADKPTFYVEVAKNIRSSEEAPRLANLYADQVASEEFSQFRGRLRVDSVNQMARGQDDGEGRYMKLSLPFSNPVEMRVEGKFLPLKPKFGERHEKEKRGFLVTEIVSLTPRLVFDRLIAHRKNSGKQAPNAGDPNLDPAWSGPRPSDLDIGEDDDVTVHSGEDPLAALNSLSIDESGGFNTPGLEIVEDPKSTQQYKNASTGSGAPDFDGSFTTGETRGGQEGSAEANAVTEEAPRVPVTLESFIETLDILRNHGHAFQTVAATSACRYDNGGNVVNFLPKTIKGHRLVRSWHLSGMYEGAPPKGYVIASIQSGGIWHYLIDIERKGLESPSVAHFWHESGAQIEPRDLKMFMNEVAIENGWRARRGRPHWIFGQPIRHTPKDGIKRFAKRIAAHIGLVLDQKT